MCSGDAGRGTETLKGIWTVQRNTERWSRSSGGNRKVKDLVRREINGKSDVGIEEEIV
jgi:hypothetical protein